VVKFCAYDCRDTSPADERCIRCQTPICMDCAVNHWHRCPACEPDAMERLELALLACKTEEERKRILRGWPHIPRRPRERRQLRIKFEEARP
jgi:hypothetical protein